MLGLFGLLFLLVPIVELYVVVQVSHLIGVLPTIALIVAISAAGAWLCKREGIGLYRRINDEIRRGQVPTTSLVDGFLVLFGGALLLTPGFVTDALGLLLLLPPVRAGVRALLVRRFAAKARQAVLSGTAGGFASGGTRVFVYDARIAGDEPPRSRPASGRGRVIDVGEATYARPDEGGRELDR